MASFLAYRGEHGDEPLLSRLGSFAFVDSVGVAAYHSLQGNHPTQPPPRVRRVLECVLTIENPLVNTPEHDTVSVETVCQKVGRDAGERLVLLQAHRLLATRSWKAALAGQKGSLAQLLEEDFERVACLPLPVQALLDCPQSVAELRKAGIDGAIYHGSGVSLDTVECRVVGLDQVRLKGVYLTPDGMSMTRALSQPCMNVNDLEKVLPWAPSARRAFPSLR